MAKDVMTMMLPLELPPPGSERGVISSVLVKDTEEMRQVFIGNAKLFEYRKDDRFYNNVAIAIVSGICYPKVDIAQAFDVSRNTVTRIAHDMESLGLAGAVDGREGPSGPSRRTPEMMKQVALLANKGLGPTEIHKRLLLKKKKKKISLRSVCRCLADIREMKEGKVKRKSPEKIEGYPLFPHEEDETQESIEKIEISPSACESGEEGDSLEALLLSNGGEAANEEEAVSAPAMEKEKDSPPESAFQNSEPISVSPTFKSEQLIEIPPPAYESGAEENSLEAVRFLEAGETTSEEEAVSAPAVEEERDSHPESAFKNSEPISVYPSFNPEQGNGVSYAGAFFAWPYLSLLGLLPLVWQLYGESLKIKGKLYGLMQSISSFFFLNLLGFDNLEAFKVVDREGFQRLIGAISSPTVKTLRGKLGVISSFGKAYEFLMGLAKRYCAMGMLELGVLYLDGHFIPYFGKRKMGKGYYTLRRLAHPGRTQHFVNDRNGRPFFFLLREANESFVKIIPELINETHSLIGDQQTTFIFDRGGQSAAVFNEIEGKGGKRKFRLVQGSISSAFQETCRRYSGGSPALSAGALTGLFMSISSIHAPLAVSACIFLGIHPTDGDLFVTYKKGKFRKMPGGVFRPHTVEYSRWGKKIEKTYDLWEGSIKITGYGNARLILVKDKGKQTPIISNDRKRPAVELVALMFNRWRQENFFKYMAANYSLDELVTQEEQEVKLLQVPNPRWHELEKKIRGARKQIAVMERGVGKIVGTGANSKIYDDERQNPFVKKVAALKRMKTCLRKLRDEQKQCPEKISPVELCQEVGNVIPQEGKIILDAVKLAVYNAEEWLLEILKSYYRDWRDPRTILRMLLQQKGDIQVKDGVVKVTLHRFEKPSYQKAARGLCEVLTSLEARSWDGRWLFEYEVAE